MSFLLTGQQHLPDTDIPIPLPKLTVQKLGLNAMRPEEIQCSILVYSLSPRVHINHVVSFFSFCGVVKKCVMGNSRSLGIDTPDSRDSLQNTPSKDLDSSMNNPYEEWEATGIDFDEHTILEQETQQTTNGNSLARQQSTPSKPIATPNAPSRRSLLDFDNFFGFADSPTTPPGSPGGNLISRLWNTTLGTPSQERSYTGNNNFAVITFEEPYAYQMALLLSDANIEGQPIRIVEYRSMLPSLMQNAIPRIDLSFIQSDRSAASVVQGLIQKGYISSGKAMDSLKQNARVLDSKLNIGNSITKSLEISKGSISKTKSIVDSNLKKIDEKLKLSNKAEFAKHGILIAGAQAKEQIGKVDERVQSGISMGWNYLKSTISATFQQEDNAGGANRNLDSRTSRRVTVQTSMSRTSTSQLSRDLETLQARNRNSTPETSSCPLTIDDMGIFDSPFDDHLQMDSQIRHRK